ncbi:MAG: hypothetical protein U9R17_13195 [Thermodesulfobacteriota bacterium]|nr:hypothetical protein [Thermodesulfobacteriota bacterium]
MIKILYIVFKKLKLAFSDRLLVEYGEDQISKYDLPFQNSLKLSRTFEDLNSIVTVIPGWGNDHYRLKADSRVGAVNVNGLRVQVRPRLSASEFCTLLSYAISGKVPPSLLRSFSELSWDIGFEDALGMLLCDEVNEIRRIGLSRRYEERIETMEVLRGRPLWDKSFPWRGNDTKKVCCRYHRLT